MSRPSNRPPLPDVTIEVTARSFYKQAVGYGFALNDFVRFTNFLLETVLAPEEAGVPSSRRFAGTDTTEAEQAAPEPPPARRSVRTLYHELPLRGSHVSIRRFGEADDRGLLDGWVADADGRFFLLSTASGRTQDVDALVRNEHNLVGMVLFEGRPVGAVAYLDFDADQRRAELRKIIGETALRGRGLAREAAELWVGYGLGALGLQKIYLNTLVTHIRNIKLNEEIGFRVEGILRNEVRVDGEPRDVLRMGLWHE